MRDLLEVIAQQIDKVAEKPLDLALYAGGGLAMWQWLGVWGLVIATCFFSTIAIMGDVVIFALRRYTFVTYKDLSVHLPGFHPFKARAIARESHRFLQEYGEQALIDAWKKHGALVQVSSEEYCQCGELMRDHPCKTAATAACPYNEGEGSPE